MSQAPPEPPDGQDGPPDLRTALIAIVRLLDDVHTFLAQHHGDDDAGRLLLRTIAVRRGVIRLREHLGDDG